MDNQPSMAFDINSDYLALPTKELLKKYGDGKHIPGSGSASALSALFGVEMMKTVCKLTLLKPTYADKHTQIAYVLELLETKYKPRLLQLFQQDIEVFNLVSVYRRQRDAAQSETEKRRFADKALEQQRIATEIPIEICELALEILPIAFSIFDDGFKSARGDSGVAISNLLSSVSGGLFVIFLNLKSFNKSKWRNATTSHAEELARTFGKHQIKA